MARQDAHILRLEQTIQFQQDLLLKQHDSLARQQIITEKQVEKQTAAVTVPGASVPMPAATATGLHRVTSHPLGASYISGGLLLLTVATVPYVTGYFRHSQDPINTSLLVLAALLGGGATSYAAFVAVKKRGGLPWAFRLANVAMSLSGLCMLSLLVRVFYGAFATVPHALQFFKLVCVVEVFVVVVVNVTLSTLGEVLGPALSRVKRKLWIKA